jgi:23S rRNA (pseudouridine1915-N3)-methyltransferase
MKVTIAAIGRLKAGAERELLERYLKRADGAGRKHGLSFSVRELPDGRADAAVLRKEQEAAALLAAFPPGAKVVALDESGQTLDSRAFADRLARWRDQGVEHLVFVIGGADGLGGTILEGADLCLAFGRMTWPHQLIRSMLAEQLYRAVTILSGHPYHRD